MKGTENMGFNRGEKERKKKERGKRRRKEEYEGWFLFFVSCNLEENVREYYGKWKRWELC